MKLSKYILLLLIPLVFTACDDEDILPAIEDVAAPSELSLAFDVANDNSGAVTILPGGRGATTFMVGFGDGSTETVEVAPGESVVHSYTQGTYNVSLTGVGINGKTTTLTQELTVDFAAPENLVVTIVGTAGNPLSIDVSATADLETGFQVFFGDVADEQPTLLQEGEVVQHEYSETGDYEVRVVAASGGTATVEEIQTVTISNPLLLPLDFESPFQTYEIMGFGGATGMVIDNPDATDSNTSGRVASVNKMSGSEVWAGVFMTLGSPLDFSDLKQVRMKTWSPRAGVPVIMKLENGADGDIFVEATQTTTAANGWEDLLFDFSAVDLSQEYQKVVIFFDFGTAGADENFYFDDIEQTDGNGTVQLPLNFEAGDVIYTFEGFGGAGAEVIDNPDASGINASNRVGSFTKEFNSETWGGVFIDVAEPVNFAGNERVKLKIWSPVAGATILLKFENPDDPDVNMEVSAVTADADQWEELEYDFTGIAAMPNIKRVVLFCDFGNAGTEQTYYFDDISLGN